MFTPTKIRFENILAVLAAGAVLVTVLPAHAGAGHGLAADQPRGFQDTLPQQCARRDTYNDIYYVNCNTIIPFGASRLD